MYLKLEVDEKQYAMACLGMLKLIPKTVYPSRIVTKLHMIVTIIYLIIYCVLKLDL